MDKRKVTLLTSVVFGLYLIAFAVVCFALSIAVAIVTDIDFTFTMFLFPVLGVSTIIGACISKKSIILTRVILTISTAAYIATLIFFATVGLYKEISVISILFIVLAVLGIVATVFSYLTKNDKVQSAIKE